MNSSAYGMSTEVGLISERDWTSYCIMKGVCPIERLVKCIKYISLVLDEY